MKKNKKNLIWIDLEMTGLNPEKHKIIEISTVITNSELKILAIGPTISIFQTQKELNLMDEWNFNIHNKTGLIKKVQNSLYNEKTAEFYTIKFLKKWVPSNFSPICGNTVAQDRRFLFKYMPLLEKYFHYRYIDVSTIKELIFRWKPNLLKKYKKIKNHSALNDIHESISELHFYRNNCFKFK
jgi:oligoribonuclease